MEQRLGRPWGGRRCWSRLTRLASWRCPSRQGRPTGAETLTIPRVSPLRGSQPEGTLIVTIGRPARRRPRVPGQ